MATPPVESAGDHPQRESCGQSSERPESRPAEQSDTAQRGRSLRRPRQLALLLVLLVLSIALAYDRYSRAASLLAYETLIRADRININQRRGRLTDGEVRVLLDGHEPSSAWEDRYVATETYRWRRGTLVDSYDVVVIYFIDVDGRRLLKDVLCNRSPNEVELLLTPSEARRHWLAMRYSGEPEAADTFATQHNAQLHRASAAERAARSR